MIHLPPSDLLDADLDETVPRAKTRWNGLSVAVTARLIPRYLFTTASIDVFLGGCCILKTGGQMAVIGSSTSEFCHDGTVHSAKLTWGSAKGLAFPYELTIDGAKVLVSDVRVQNPALFVVPGLVMASPFLVPLLVRILLDFL